MSPPTAHNTSRELAELVHQFLGHQVETSSQLSSSSKESLTAATECIEQAYELPKRPPPSDRLLRIYESHISAMANANSSLPSNQQHNHQQAAETSGPGGSSSSSSSTSAAHKLSHLIPGSHHHNRQRHSIRVSVYQKHFKQKLIALIKKFRTDGSNFDTEEQYREALERELIKATSGRGSTAIEELFEEEIDDVDAESDNSGPDDWDNISESSTPKPSLRPFFSSTTLDKI